MLSRKKRVYFDYSKWLGPDQKPAKYEGAGINICNHLSAFDLTIMLAVTWPMSSFIAKDELRCKLFLLKDFLGVMFVKRNNQASAEDRDQLLEQIRARQIEAENGTSSPLTIFPEGGTTNGEYIISFKKGAFQTLRAVKPHFITHKTLTGTNIANGATYSTIAYYVMQPFMQGLSIYDLNEMPVFEPNEYFWKNHWDGKEE